MRKHINNYLSNSAKKISPELALAHLLDTNKSKIDYEKECKLLNVSLTRILPPYFLVEAEKAKCRPPGIEANAHEVVVPLQSLLDHTVSRILDDEDIQLQINRLIKLNDDQPLLLEFLYKYGSDGTGGLGKFKQKADESYVPGKLYATSMVPLQIVTYVGQKIFILYNNHLVNSSLSVRPLRHQYLSESTEIIKKEDARLENEISCLHKMQWTEKISIGYLGFKSMLDQKVLIAIAESSSQKCPYCGCGLRDFNDLLKFFRANPELLAELCLSPLHFGIRGMEHIFKVGFNQDFKQFYCRGEENHNLKEIRKAKILKRFKDLGLCFTQVTKSNQKLPWRKQFCSI